MNGGLKLLTSVEDLLMEGQDGRHGAHGPGADEQDETRSLAGD